MPGSVGSTPGSLTLSGKLSHPYLTPGTSDVFLTRLPDDLVPHWDFDLARN